MEARAGAHSPVSPTVLSNAEIADRLARLAQLLSLQKDNPYKVRAYQRAAARLRNLPDSVDELVRQQADLTRYAGIGAGIAAAIREIVLTGTLSKYEQLLAQAGPAAAGLTEYPRLDPVRVQRAYKKLGISSLPELRHLLESGELEKRLGPRMAQHLRQGLTESHAMLLYKADDLAAAVQDFLIGSCGVRRAALAGECRRRVEVIEELGFVIETDNFPAVIARLQRYGGRTPLLSSGKTHALFALSSGVRLRVQQASTDHWGLRMIACTGSPAHLEKLAAITGNLRQLISSAFPTEAALYGNFGLAYIEPELREGRDEIDRAAAATLPNLVSASDMLGELHAHSSCSDGRDSIETMAEAAQARGYQYLGITDHSQTLKIARGVSAGDLGAQIRFIDKLNSRLKNFRVLKSAEVDILADGSLDYPDDLLRELDYTVCSIHSRFGLNKQEQTERILRAMDSHYFHILGHPTGRLLLKRPGYEIDLDRILVHARQTGCFVEINSSPDRLDLCADNARKAAAAGVMIAVSTDAHSTGELDLLRCGIDQARRAGLQCPDILNSRPWQQLQRLFRR